MEFKLEEILTEDEYLMLDNDCNLTATEDWLLAFLKLGFRRTEPKNPTRLGIGRR